MKTLLDKLSSCVIETEECTGTVENQLVKLDSHVIKLRRKNYFLMDEVDLWDTTAATVTYISLISRRQRGERPCRLFVSLDTSHYWAFTEPLIIE